MVTNSTNIYKNKQSPLILTELAEHKKTTKHMMEIQVLAWDRHTNCITHIKLISYLSVISLHKVSL